MNAYDVASNPVNANTGERLGFGFSINEKAMADELRRLATAIDEHRVLPQKVHTIQIASTDAFAVTRIVLQVCEKRP